MLHNLERLTVPKYCQKCRRNFVTADKVCPHCVCPLLTIVYSAIDGRRLDTDPEPSWGKEQHREIQLDRHESRSDD